MTLRVALALLAAVLALAGCAAPRCGPASLAYAGTESGDVLALRLDSCSGRLDALGTVARVAKPRWIVGHPQRPQLLVAGESSVASFQVDRVTGALSPLVEAASGGQGTTHLWLDADSATLLAAHFGSGSVSSLPLGEDGRVGAAVSTVQHSGSGPHRRQASAHAHGVALDPSGRFALVADMGADRVFVHRFDRGTRRLAAADAGAPRALAVPPGSGPRHFEFGADGRFVYLLHELTAELMVLRWDAESGRLAVLQTLSILGPDSRGAPSASEIARSADGRFLYVGNRGESQLLVYRIDARSGELALLQRTGSGGQRPWAFALDSSGGWLLVANHGSNAISLFRIDPRDGTLADTGQRVAAAQPLSLAWLP
jgi:6-phosphogluconolactonase